MNEAGLNYDALKIWVDVLQFLILGGFAVGAWLVRKSDNTAEIVTKHGERLATLEADLSGMPSHTDITALRAEMSQTRAAVENVAGELKQITNLVSTINEFLLNRGADK